MRKRFEQQLEIGVKPIFETPVLLKSRDDIPALVLALLTIYNISEYNIKIFNLLEKLILGGKKETSRPRLNLWQIFVLSQFRLALNLDYDRLHHMIFSDSILRIGWIEEYLITARPNRSTSIITNNLFI